MSLRFTLLLGIVALNAFFAAAEVALVSVRRSRLSELAAQGNVSARAALELLANPERLLSVTQVGVTLASLGLGWAGEQTLYNAILGLFTISFLGLMYLGMQPAQGIYVTLSRVLSVPYFLFFLLMPWYSKWDPVKPVPERVTFHG